jgi:NAD(P)H-dependent FMN reductase
MPTLNVIIASTRPGRAGLPIANWFVDHAKAHGGFDVIVTDLLELDLPFMNEANHPRLQQYEHQHTKDWSAIVAGSDAFVFVMPEYNYAFTAPLKNALDYLHNEWRFKPVGFVSYGGVAAGNRAVESLRGVMAALSMFPLAAAVHIPFFSQFFNDDGEIEGNEVMNNAAIALLDELVRVESTFRELRA